MSAPLPVEPVADGTSMRRVADALGDRITMRRGDHQLYARCPVPAHDDRNPSLSVTWKLARDGGGRTFVRCQAACGQDDVVRALGLSLSDLYDTPPARPAGERQRWTPQQRPARPKRAKSSPSVGSRGKVKWPDPTAVYTYADVDGVRVYDVLRYEVTEDWPQKFGVRSYDRTGQRIVARKAPAKERRVLYRLPEVAATIAADGVVYVVEGEKDADTVTGWITEHEVTAAATCNAFGSADTPGRAAEKWLPQYTEALRGAHVVIVPDRDDAGYRHAWHVATQLEHVTASLEVREPTAGKDATDHMAAGGSVADLAPVPLDELRARATADAAPAPAEPAPEQTRPTEQPADDGEPAGTIDLAGERERRRGGGGGSGDGSDGGSGDGTGSGEPDWMHVVVRDRFEATDEGLFKVKVNSEARLVTHQELLPVKVTLAGRIREDLGDGEDPEVTHLDLVAERDGMTHEMRRVPREQYEKCDWVLNLPWPAPFQATQGGRAMLRKAIEATSGQTPLRTMYKRFGWQEINGRQVYVHAAGALDAAGPVADILVNPAPELRRLTLAPPPVDTAELRAAVEASTVALDVLPPRLMAPLLGAAYRACLGWSPVTVNPVGRRASGKTGLAALTMQHYDPTARYNSLPGAGAGEAAGTTGGIEELRFLASDMLQPLDDLAPDRGPERASARLSELARSQYNRTGRVRMRRDGGLRPTHAPGGTQLITGEESTMVESGDSRIVSLRVRPGDVDKACVLPTLDRHGDPERRAQLIAAMVVHYAPQMPMTQWLADMAASLRDGLVDREALDPDQDLRHAESLAHLATGWRAMLDMATTQGALTEAEATDLWNRAWAGLVECKRHLMAGSATRTPADRVRELLRALLHRRDVVLTSRDGGEPTFPSRCGWQRVDTGPGGPDSWYAAGPPVGWTDGEHVWLHPGALYPALDRQASAEKEPLNLTRDGLSQALAACGVTRTRQVRGITRYTVPVRLGPDRVLANVWEIKAAWLWPAEDDPDDPEPGDSDDPEAAPPAPPAPTVDVPAASPHVPPRPPASPVGTEHEEETGRGPESHTEPPTSSAGSTQASPPQAASGVHSGSERPRQGRGQSPRPVREYRALGVVCDSDGAWLARPGAAPVEAAMPPAPVTVESLLSWADGLELGHVDGRGNYRGARQAYGQIWVRPALRKALGWPTELTEREDGKESAAARKVRESIEAAGWTIRTGKTRGNLVSAWTAIYREGRPSYHLVVPDWLHQDSEIGEHDGDAAELARRLGRYAEVTGIAYQWTPAVTGVRLMATTRPALLSSQRPTLPEPARKNELREGDFSWSRAPEPDERRYQWLDAWDFNGLYLGAATSLPLAWGTYRYVEDPEVDLTRPGLWLVSFPEWTEPRLPDPWQATRRGKSHAASRAWVTTPSLKLADRLGMLEELTIHGAHLATGGLDAHSGEEKSGAFRLDDWARELRDARQAVGDDPIALAVKNTYGGGVGRLDYHAWRGLEPDRAPMWRPDIRASIVAQARFAVLHRILTAAEAEVFPLAIVTDAVVYPSNAPLTKDAAPAGFTVGSGLGQVKHVGRVPMADAADLLTTEDRQGGRLMEAVKAGEQLVVDEA